MGTTDERNTSVVIVTGSTNAKTLIARNARVEQKPMWIIVREMGKGQL